MATSDFGKAFAAARKAGLKTFEHNGKKITTQTREEAAGGAQSRARKAGSDFATYDRLAKSAPAGTSAAARAALQRNAEVSRSRYEREAKIAENTRKGQPNKSVVKK